MAYIARSLKNGQGNIESQKFKVITIFLSRKLTLNANLERFTKFLNHKTLELYGIVFLHRSSFMGARGLRLLTGGP